MPTLSARARRRLIDLVVLLHGACMRYDSAEGAEARVMAACLRALFHDSATVVSVAQTAGLKAGLSFYDSGNYEFTRGLPHCALTWTFRESYLPSFDDFADDGRRVFLPFAHWWARKVLSNQAGEKFSRQKIVLMAAEEGGSAQPRAAALRQMAYETLVSLAVIHPDLLDGRLAAYYRELHSTREVYEITGVLDAMPA